MNQKSLRVLEFNKIIDILSTKVSSSLGLKYIEKLTPSSDFEEVKYMLEETSQAQGILLKRGGLALNGIHDIEDKAKRAQIGASLDAGSLIKIADTLRVARTLKNSLSSSSEEEFNYPIIQGLSNALYDHRDVEDKIYNAISLAAPFFSAWHIIFSGVLQNINNTTNIPKLQIIFFQPNFFFKNIIKNITNAIPVTIIPLYL